MKGESAFLIKLINPEQDMSAGFLNFSGFDAPGANILTFYRTIFLFDPNFLNVGKKGVTRFVMGVTDTVPHLPFLAANITHCHDFFPPERTMNHKTSGIL